MRDAQGLEDQAHAEISAEDGHSASAGGGLCARLGKQVRNGARPPGRRQATCCKRVGLRRLENSMACVTTPTPPGTDVTMPPLASIAALSTSPMVLPFKKDIPQPTTTCPDEIHSAWISPCRPVADTTSSL